MWRQLWRKWTTTIRSSGLPRSTRSVGDSGEESARRHLQRLGWTILDRHVLTRFSELDLVAVEGRTIVFVEVKSRRGASAMETLSAVDAAKQRRIVHAAMAFLKKHQLLEQRVRFDVVAVTWPDDTAEPEIKHVRNAFDSPFFGQFFG